MADHATDPYAASDDVALCWRIAEAQTVRDPLTSMMAIAAVGAISGVAGIESVLGGPVAMLSLLAHNVVVAAATGESMSWPTLSELEETFVTGEKVRRLCNVLDRKAPRHSKSRRKR